MGVLNKDRETRGISAAFGNLYVEQAPKYMELLTLEKLNPYARYDDNFTVEINGVLPIKDSNEGGLIKINYPEDFYMDVFNGVCKTEDRFSLYSVCSQFYNTYELNAANKFYDFTEQGSLTFQINNHRGAEYEGLTGPLTVFNYDKTTKQVVAKTYSTLSLSYFNYTYDGLQLLVNDGKPYKLEVGSISDPISVGAVEKMKQRLTVVPLYFDSNFIFGDIPVTLVPGTLGSSMKLAAPQNMLLKRFYITFAKSGDIISKFYSPIPKFPVDIVKGTLLRDAIPYQTLYVNRGGLSIPMYVSIKNPPYELVNVEMTVSNAEASKVKMNATVLPFGKTSFRLYYLLTDIDASYSDSNININFALTGVDSSSFQMVPSSITIPVNAADPEPAPLVDFRIIDNSRGTVKVFVKSNKLCYIYCVTGHKHMPDPTYEGVKGKNLSKEYSYSNPVYHEGYVDGAAFEGVVTIDGLQPGYDYSTFCYTMNLNRVPSPNYGKLNFQNKKPQRMGTFTMKVNQAIVSQELRDEYIKRLATLMEIQSNRVREKILCKSDTPVGSEPRTTYITYYVLPDPLNTAVDISPINLIRALNKRRSEIKKFVPKLDPGNLLVMKELKEKPPVFNSRPIMDQRGTEWITVNVSVSACGYIMVAAQPIIGSRWLLSTNATLFFFENQLIKNLYPKNKEFYPFGIENAQGEINTFSEYGGPDYRLTENSPSTRMLKVIEYTKLTLKERFPTSFQMNRTLEQTNQPEPLSFTQEVDDSGQVWTINITGLQDNLIHNIYVGAVSDRPVYPDYMETDYVAQINLKTIKKRRLLNIYSIHKANIFSFAFKLFSLALFVLGLF